MNERGNVKFASNRQFQRGDRLVEDQAERAISLQAEIDDQESKKKEAITRRDDFQSQLQQVKDRKGALDQRLKTILLDIRRHKISKKRLEEDVAEMQAEQVPILTPCT